MQPDRDKQTWQQPTEQLSQAPYTAPPSETSVSTPVVSLTPDSSIPQATENETTNTDPVIAAPAVAAQPPTTPVQAEVVPEPEIPEEAAPAQPEEEPVRWQAHEYIHHDKSPVWFILFAIVVIALMAVAIFLMQSITFAILVPVMAAALLVYSHRPPRLLDYTLSRQGLHINDHLYSFTQFKGFGVIRDGEEYSVMLIPTKRFQPGVSVYFPEESGEAIVDMLGARLPMQELQLDVIDKVVRKLRI